MKQKEPPLAPHLQGQLFELFLNGLSLVDIVKANRGVQLGAVVRAAIEGNWWERRDEYRDSLLNHVRDRVVQTQNESIVFVTHLLAAANKRYGEKIIRYLQTGDEKELGELAVDSIDQYRKVAELLLKLTGQEGSKGGGDDKVLKKTLTGAPPPPQATGRTVRELLVDPTKPLDPTVADDLLKKLGGG